MKAHPLAGNYAYLTPEERFRLILAASQRGDEAERDRLVQAGSRLEFSMAGHAPYAHAFGELEMLTFLDLLEEASSYIQALACIDEAGDEDEGQTDEGQTDESGAVESADDRGWLARKQSLDLALAAGYLLLTKADGWKQFCEEMQVPQFLLWKSLPGFNRLKRALALAEEVAFTPEEFLRWLNGLRPAAEPELIELPPTGAAVAAEITESYRSRVRWWGG